MNLEHRSHAQCFTAHWADGHTTSRTNWVCFGPVVHSIPAIGDTTIKYDIFMYHRDIHHMSEAVNNDCLMNPEELTSYINELLKFCPNYRNLVVSEIENGYNVSLTITGDQLVHKCILFWIRNAYEFPFNMYIRDAYKMSEVPELQLLSLRNRLQLIHNSTDCGYTLDQSFFTRYHYMVPDGWFAHSLSSRNIRMCSSINGIHALHPIAKIPGRITDPEEWDNAEKQAQRIEIYKQNLPQYV